MNYIMETLYSYCGPIEFGVDILVDIYGSKGSEEKEKVLLEQENKIEKVYQSILQKLPSGLEERKMTVINHIVEKRASSSKGEITEEEKCKQLALQRLQKEYGIEEKDLEYQVFYLDD